MPSMADIPRPDVSVTEAGGKEHLVISRKNGSGNPVGRSYEIRGDTSSDKIKNIISDVLNDPYTGEWLP